jgi:hypothetical protein
MDDAERMRFGDGLACLEQEIDGVGDREWSALDDRTEVLTFEELHDDVRRAFRSRADVDDLDRMLAAEARRRARLAHEALDEIFVACEMGREDLDRDALMELRVACGDDDAADTPVRSSSIEA